MQKNLLNVLLRCFVLASKFFLIGFLGVCLSQEEFGVYGLVTGYVAFSVLIVGIDYYAFAHRRYFCAGESKKKVIKEHGMASLFGYATIFPLFLFFISKNNYVASLMPMFVALCVVEHLSQECYRYLNIENRQLTATISYMIRSALWVLPLYIFYELNIVAVNLRTVLLFWLGGSVISIALVFIHIEPIVFLKILREKVDKGRIKIGLQKSFVFILATFALKGLFTFDRQLVEVGSSIEHVGVYTVYVQFAMIVFNFVDAGLLSYIYPRLLRASSVAETNQKTKYELLVAATSVLIGVLLIVFLPPILKAVGFKSTYDFRSIEFYIVVIAIVFYSMSMIPHYYLYSMGMDFHNLVVHAFVFILFLTLSWISIVMSDGFFGIVRAFLIANIALYLAKKSLLIFAQKK